MENVEQKIHKIKTQIEDYFGTKLPETAVSVEKHTNIAAYIDHTLLAPTTNLKDVERICEEAIEYQFRAVCIPPRFVSFAQKLLWKVNTTVATVVGFPLGYNKSSTKRLETLKAVENGASEIDMVLPLGALLNENWKVVRKDIQFVVEAAQDIPVKVILETGFLTPDQIIAGCFISLMSKARYVKTSTGFGPRGASLEDIHIMNATIGGKMGIKASGGIRGSGAAWKMIEAGATRIGTSAGIEIVKSSQSNNL